MRTTTRLSSPRRLRSWRRRPTLLALTGALAVLVVSFAAAGCAPPGGGEGPGHRRQPLALTPLQELQLGRKAYDEVLQKANGKVLPESDPQVARVRNVGERIIQAAQIEPLQWEINLNLRGYYFEPAFSVIEDRQVNAFCLPGCKVCVFTGLFPVAQDDDALATVLGHEVAHALAHHASERVARAQMFEHYVGASGGTVVKLVQIERPTLMRILGGIFV